MRTALRICFSISMSEDAYFLGHRLVMGKCLLRPVGLGHPWLCGKVVLHKTGVLLGGPMGVGSDATQ